MFERIQSENATGRLNLNRVVRAVQENKTILGSGPRK